MKPSILGRVLTRLFALFGITLTCVACYGTPYEEYRFDFEASGRVVDGEVVKFEDIDGEANGGDFRTREITVGWDNYSDLGDVELEKKDK